MKKRGRAKKAGLKVKTKTEEKIKYKFLFWCPRILVILFIIFLSIFALDIFSMNLGVWGTIVGMFMHLIPSLILLAVLLFSWKTRRGWIAGIVFILFGLLYIIITIRAPLEWYIALSWSLTIAGPAFIIGILFILDWVLNRK